MKDIFRLPKCRKLIILLFIAQSGCVHLFSQQTYWQQQVDFLIDVTLDDKAHSLEGYEKITYSNHSPDTLSFIWFHIWPNAYKNDRTAFSEQLLRNGRTDFYFSKKEQRGYINRLDFKVDGVTAVMEDHPQHIDIIKIVLPKPLPPGASININTAFHVQLPENFSRGGHKGQAYQVTQWFPKPAVYDRKGWHPMPYLDQGEFYSEFGNYDVRITVPSNYIVAATGMIQNENEKGLLKKNEQALIESVKPLAGQKTKKPVKPTFPESASTTKTLRYIQQNVHDFAWFADKRFIVKYDTLQLSSGRIIDLFSYQLPAATSWNNSITFIKDAVRTRSAWLGEYPYDVLSIVEAEMGVAGGMEYPTITSISPIESEKENDRVIAHEVGHNWLQGILATNERKYPWMDEGMNSYYDSRYEKLKYSEEDSAKANFRSKRLPGALDELLFQTMAKMKLDQPINTSSDSLSLINYDLISYHKAAMWMKKLEETLGTTVFDSSMKKYFERWKFKHPYPEDFKQVMEEVSGKNIDALFATLDEKGPLYPATKKSLKLTSYFNLKETDKYQYIALAPAVGYNTYDGLQLGLLVHNYQLPLPRLQFLVAPLYGTTSKKINGVARASYSWYPSGNIQKVETGAAYAAFTMDDFETQGFARTFLRVRKFVPFVKLTIKREPTSSVTKSLQFKSFFINEDDLEFKQVVTGTDTSDVINTISTTHTIVEGKFTVSNDRALYPYRAEWSLQYHKDFLRAAFTGNYFYNYSSNKGGIGVRWFVGKFMYTGATGIYKRFATDRYHLNLTGARGYEDYTYSNYFIGRNEFEGLGSQQLMIRDGGLKVGTDLLDAKVGKTDDWLSALNFTVHIPDISDHLPIKAFFDIGTYAEAWEKNAEGSRFLYDAGLQLSLLKETINIYLPIFYSSVYRNYFKSTLGDQRLLKTISFSINIQDVNLKKIRRDLVF